MAAHLEGSQIRDEQHEFATHGYLVHRQLLEPCEIARYCALLEALRRNPAEPSVFRRERGGFTHVEGLTAREEFWPVVFNERLLAVVRRLLGDDIRYIRHTDLHVDYPLSPRWHFDLEEPLDHLARRLAGNPVPFRILRAGLYLGEDMRFGIVPGSHLRSRRRLERQAGLANRVNRLLGHITESLVCPPLPSHVIWLHLDPGDCVLFDIRLLHTGHYARPPKYAILLCFGAANAHSVLHNAQFLGRPQLIDQPIPAAFCRQLAEAGLYLGDHVPVPAVRPAPVISARAGVGDAIVPADALAGS